MQRGEKQAKYKTNYVKSINFYVLFSLPYSMRSTNKKQQGTTFFSICILHKATTFNCAIQRRKIFSTTVCSHRLSYPRVLCVM